MNGGALKHLLNFWTFNSLALLISLSALEDGLRLLALVVGLVYSFIKIYKELRNVDSKTKRQKRED